MVKKKSDAPRQHIRLMEKSFQPALLGQPLKRKRIIKNKQLYLVPLAQPLKPTRYVPPKPTPPPEEKDPFLFPELKKPKSLILECKS